MTDAATPTPIRAVLFDFGGVILSSPFDAFAAYEAANDLPDGLIRRINTINPDDNAWAKLERSDVDAAGFAELFTAEAAALGHQVNGADILGLLHGSVRPRMVEAVRRVKAAGYVTGCLTNNFLSGGDREKPGSGIASDNSDRQARIDEVMALFDDVIESSKVGVRKPERAFYDAALEALEITAQESVFLDDLGINLKPARAMGMHTIKVVDPDDALAELSALLDLEL